MSEESPKIETDFVVRLPTGEGICPVTVEPMTDEHARCWQAIVQPEIDKSSEARADKGWRWRRIYGTSLLNSSLPSTSGWRGRWDQLQEFGTRLLNMLRSRTAWTQLIRQKPSAFAICLRDISTGGPWDFLPCVMTALVERYPALDDRRHKSVFLWYLSTAPAPLLSTLLPGRAPKRLGQAGLDIARTRSFCLGYNGRVGLHADPGGGVTLVKWYEQQGMTRLPETAGPITPGVRKNDGRYFYYTPENALKAQREIDDLRPQGTRPAGDA